MNRERGTVATPMSGSGNGERDEAQNRREEGEGRRLEKHGRTIGGGSRLDRGNDGDVIVR